MRGRSAAASGRGGLQRAVDSLAPVLGLVFIALAGVKLNATGGFVARFQESGLPQALVVPTGVVELLLGLGVLAVETRTVASGALAVWMAGAALVHGATGSPGPAGVSAILGLLPAAVAWAGVRRGLHRRITFPAPLAAPPGRGLAAVGFILRVVGVSFLVRWAGGGMFFWAGALLLGLGHGRRYGAFTPVAMLRCVLLYLLVLGVGVSGIWGFIGHLFLSDEVARSIGWAPGSPFQHELAFYHLAMGTVGLLSLWIQDRFWIAAGLTPIVFALGAGLVHVSDFLVRSNAAPANWGWDVLVGNFLIPALLLALLIAYGRLGGWHGRSGRGRR